MCGRYVSVSTPEQLAEHFGVDRIRTGTQGERYNVAPTLDVYSVIEHEGSRRLGTLRWGFVPFWSKGPKKGPAPINARVESIHDNRMFRRPFERHRCLLPADGFYEWQDPSTEGGRKTPFFISHADGEPLAFAGIWSSWRADDDSEPLYSCAIVTRDAVGRMAEIHDRMPLMLPRRLWDEWLANEDVPAERLQQVVSGAEPPPLRAVAVTTRVNNVRNDGPELLEPAGD